MMENSSPFMGDLAPTLDRHMTIAFAGRHILQVVTLSLRSVNCDNTVINPELRGGQIPPSTRQILS
jgi:hypothetical protein